MALRIWQQAQGSAEQIEAKDKVHRYVRPSEVAALLRLHGVPEEDWAETLERVLILEAVDNRLRPARPQRRPLARGR